MEENVSLYNTDRSDCIFADSVLFCMIKYNSGFCKNSRLPQEERV